MNDDNVGDNKDNSVNETVVNAPEEKDPTREPKLTSHLTPPSNTKPDSATQQKDPAPTKPGQAASTTNTVTQVGQTTWQKLSNWVLGGAQPQAH